VPGINGLGLFGLTRQSHKCDDSSCRSFSQKW
jgi:hypothetical protein